MYRKHRKPKPVPNDDEVQVPGSATLALWRQAQNGHCVAATDLTGNHSIAEAVHDMTDRIVFPHIERIVSAHQHMARTEEFDEVPELTYSEHLCVLNI